MKMIIALNILMLIKHQSLNHIGLVDWFARFKTGLMLILLCALNAIASNC